MNQIPTQETNSLDYETLESTRKAYAFAQLILLEHGTELNPDVGIYEKGDEIITIQTPVVNMFPDSDDLDEDAGTFISLSKTARRHSQISTIKLRLHDRGDITLCRDLYSFNVEANGIVEITNEIGKNICNGEIGSIIYALETTKQALSKLVTAQGNFPNDIKCSFI